MSLFVEKWQILAIKIIFIEIVSVKCVQDDNNLFIIYQISI